jgi:UDP-2-acetamido-2,6-beta-L-arabino-hexul-4-ose reductase
MFVEVLKTRDSGQVSFFTAMENVTRGEHFHHTKTEKFLVVKGDARFRFRNLDTDQLVEVFSSCEHSEIVETIPGWAHDVTNVGSGKMLVIVWANEVFDRENPDTYPAKAWSD